MKSSPVADRFRIATARGIVVLALSLIAGGAAFDSDYLRYSGETRATFESVWTPIEPEYAAFLRDVAGRTVSGDRVLIVLETPAAYPYFYAMYELPGRIVIGANSKSRKNTDLVKFADAVAVWPEGFAVPPEFDETYHAHGGMFVRKAR
jgi:hypothetical protein